MLAAGELPSGFLPIVVQWSVWRVELLIVSLLGLHGHMRRPPRLPTPDNIKDSFSLPFIKLDRANPGARHYMFPSP